jgi:thiamine-phosphate pyrophosphorylase
VSDRHARLARARLYLVCDEREPAFLHAALRGGVDLVQLRMKGASDDAIGAAARRMGPICAQHGALFIVNDRPDLAAEVGADGVHVGQDDTSIATARQLVGPERLVGLSTHTPEQVDAAGRHDVDYIGVGPVHATPTKPGRAAVGLALVEYAAAHARVPFFAIGGIDIANLTAVRTAGARRVAVVRALIDADDPNSAAAELARGLACAPEGSVVGA